MSVLVPLHGVSFALPRSPQLRSIWQRGYDARLRGVSRYSCPYDDRRGWTAVRRAAWITGWLAAHAITDPAPLVNVDDDYPEET